MGNSTNSIGQPSDLMGLFLVIYGDLMNFNGDFNCDLMGFTGNLMGFTLWL